MGRYKRNPMTGCVDRSYAVLGLMERLHRALADWQRYADHQNSPDELLAEALEQYLGAERLRGMIDYLQSEESGENE